SSTGRSTKKTLEQRLQRACTPPSGTLRGSTGKEVEQLGHWTVTLMAPVVAGWSGRRRGRPLPLRRRRDLDFVLRRSVLRKGYGRGVPAVDHVHRPGQRFRV